MKPSNLEIGEVVSVYLEGEHMYELRTVVQKVPGSLPRYKVTSIDNVESHIGWNGTAWVPVTISKLGPATVPGYTYALLIPPLTITATDLGYALAVHGSLSRDCDLVAIPWTADAVDAEVLVKKLADSISGVVTGNSEVKLHGRVAWTIAFMESWASIDISVMPKVS